MSDDPADLDYASYGEVLDHLSDADKAALVERTYQRVVEHDSGEVVRLKARVAELEGKLEAAATAVRIWRATEKVTRDERDDYAARLKAADSAYRELSRTLDGRVDYLTDELVDAWHDGHRTTEPLRVVLGMDRVEYAAWVERRPAQDASEPASGLELPLDAPTQLAAESGARVEATAACVCQLYGANPGLHAAIRRARERGWTDDGLATAVDCFDDLRPATYSEVEP